MLRQDEAQALVALLPKVGSGQAMTHVEPERNLGELQDKQLVAVPEQVAQLESQILQILWSLTSPNWLRPAQELSQVLVMLLPQRGLGHALTQLAEFK